MSGSYTYVDAFQARTVSNGLERPRKVVRTPSPGEAEETDAFGVSLSNTYAGCCRRGGISSSRGRNTPLDGQDLSICFRCFLFLLFSQPQTASRPGFSFQGQAMQGRSPGQFCSPSIASHSPEPAGSLSLPICEGQGRRKESQRAGEAEEPSEFSPPFPPFPVLCSSLAEEEGGRKWEQSRWRTGKQMKQNR